MEPGARPMTALASWPTLRTRSSSLRGSTATTLGSRMMMPRPFMYTRGVGGAQINADVFGKHSVYSPEKSM